MRNEEVTVVAPGNDGLTPSCESGHVYKDAVFFADGSYIIFLMPFCEAGRNALSTPQSFIMRISSVSLYEFEKGLYL